jgi:hypothetical protein
MIRRLFLFTVIALIVLLGSSFAKAAGIPGNIYVNSAATTNGDGTMGSPYNNLLDAVNKARSLSGGAWIHEKQTTGAWVKTLYVSPVVSGGTGLPLPTVSLYVLLAVVALVMAVAGLQFRRRSRQLQH